MSAMLKKMSRTAAALVASLALGGAAFAASAPDAQALTQGVSVYRTTLSACQKEHRALLSQAMKQGRHITFIQYCRYQHRNSYQGHIHWQVKPGR